MLPGLNVFTATRTTDGTSTIHTVPAGISYQVVHLVMTASATVTGFGSCAVGVSLNGQSLASCLGASGETNVSTRVLTVILSPGDTFDVSLSSVAGSCTAKGVVYISGYDVP